MTAHTACLNELCLCVLQVAFFLPQLVQLLRGDGNGMIQRFLFAAAARSNVFAYNLVCILKVCKHSPTDMLPTSASMQPSLCLYSHL